MDISTLDGFKDLCYIIFNYLEIDDLLRLAYVNRQFNQVVRNYDSYWKQLIAEIANPYYIYFGHEFTNSESLSNYSYFLKIKNFMTERPFTYIQDAIILPTFYSYMRLVEVLAIASPRKFWYKLHRFYKQIKEKGLDKLLRYLTLRDFSSPKACVDGCFRLNEDDFITWYYNQTKKTYKIVTTQYRLIYDASHATFMNIVEQTLARINPDITTFLSIMYETLF